MGCGWDVEIPMSMSHTGMALNVPADIIYIHDILGMKKKIEDQ